MNVNLSAKHFEHPNLVEDLRAIITRTMLPPQSLTVEITESAAVGTSLRIVGTLNEIKDLGLEITIDDFGTGYSALIYLSHLPISALKIDQSFVQSMATNGKNVEVVRAIIALAASLGLNASLRALRRNRRSPLSSRWDARRRRVSSFRGRSQRTLPMS
jgi:diguanylate cyclase